MAGKKPLDVKRLSSPGPVFERQEAIEGPAFDGLEVLVDTKTSAENIRALLNGIAGIHCTVGEGEGFKVNASKI